MEKEKKKNKKKKKKKNKKNNNNKKNEETLSLLSFFLSMNVFLPPDSIEILMRCLAPSNPNIPKYFLASNTSTPSYNPHK